MQVFDGGQPGDAEKQKLLRKEETDAEVFL